MAVIWEYREFCLARMRQQRTNRKYQSYFIIIFFIMSDLWVFAKKKKAIIIRSPSDIQYGRQYVQFERIIYEWYFFQDCRTYCSSIFRVIAIWTHALATKKATYTSKPWTEYKFNGVWSMFPFNFSSFTFSIDWNFHNQVDAFTIRLMLTKCLSC